MKISLDQQTVVDPEQLMKLYLTKNYDSLSAYFLSVLSHFQNKSYMVESPALLTFVNAYVENLLYFFTKADYTISKNFAAAFIRSNAAIANLVALSGFNTTDAQLELLKSQPNNLIKILSLYSARNHPSINPKALFDADARLASLWYIHFFDLYTTALASAQSSLHLKQMVSFQDSRLECVEPITRLYFGSTYIDGKNDKLLKGHLNRTLQAQNQVDLSFDEHYQNNKIAVFSACWRSSHAVYKNQFRFIEELRDDYELTFFPLRKNQDSELFHRVDTSCMEDAVNLDPVLKEKFRLIYYPDIGMSHQSILLANLRLAPIQVGCFGHSVSTHGADIDYFVVGEKIEDLSLWQENYSERLVLLSGLGIIHKAPPYALQHPVKKNSRLVINCSCSAQKCNYDFLKTLQKVLKESSTPLLFRLFVGTGALRDNGYIPFYRAVSRVLGNENVEIITHKPYDEYMTLMEEADFAIDSFHFAGCNTIVDALHLEKPIATWQGSKWYNRIGAQQLYALDLGELVANSEDEYIRLILRLIEEGDYRASLVQKIKNLNLPETELFSRKSAATFKKAIDYLMQNHEVLQAQNSREPIRIS